MIESLHDSADAARMRAQLAAIFFESATRQAFASEAEKHDFFARWAGGYVDHLAEHVWLYREDRDQSDRGNNRWGDQRGDLLGYLTGCLDSAGTAIIAQRIPKYDLFADQFAEFPAHLHVNCRTDARNRGIGAALVEHFAQHCAAQGLSGIHLVTAPHARNVRFYTRLGFTERVEREGLLFLGRRLVRV